MELREFAERVLMGESLEEKLLLDGAAEGPLTDDAPEGGVGSGSGGRFVMPEGPGRPVELRIAEKGVKADFPGTNRLAEDGERGKLLHFLANHELLATELMALVLLKFPNAPKEFRLGVYETLKEEQAHTLMYMRRMRECGVEFGELPVNDYFWRVVAPMESPMDFVSRLSLVFEQANLDYSKHYAGLFREAGDGGTARVLEKIYEDEIGHVGHGLKWFRQWKGASESDWEAFRRVLHFPLAVVRAKGVAPYNEEGRRRAGLPEEWIDKLAVEQQSRGRTPVVHWFNANVEGEAAARAAGVPFCPKKSVLALEQDLDVLPMAWARREDVVVVREAPSHGHVKYLQECGWPMVEFVERGEDEELRGRRVGGLRPWAWDDSGAEVLGEYAGEMSEKVRYQWQEGLGDEWFSKQVGVRLGETLGVNHGDGVRWCKSVGAVEDAVREYAVEGGDVLLKAAYGAAGRGHMRLLGGEWSASSRGWLRRVIADQGGVVVERWRQRVEDFSCQYEVLAGGEVRWVGMAQVLNDAAGRFRGIKAHGKWSMGYGAELSAFLFRDMRVNAVYREEVRVALEELFAGSGYVGPVGVDAMVYQEDGEYRLRKVVEVNVRMTMGRVALELLGKTAPGLGGRLQIVRLRELESVEAWRADLRPGGAVTGGLGEGDYVLNDVVQAEEFVAVWRVGGV